MESLMYNLVMYEEMEVFKFVDCLQNSSGKNISQVEYAYICHDKDLTSKGEIKKAHYHLFIRFPSPVKSSRIEHSLELCELPLNYLSYSKTNLNFLAYLTHSTKDSINKALYKFDEITSNINDLKDLWEEAVEKVNQPSRAEKKIAEFGSLIITISDIVSTNDTIIDFSSLAMYLKDNGHFSELKYCMDRSYAIKEMFKVAFRCNSIKYSSSQLKNENINLLSNLKQEYEKLDKQNTKLIQMVEEIELCKK